MDLTIIFIIALVMYSIFSAVKTSRKLETTPEPSVDEFDNTEQEEDYEFEGDECSLEKTRTYETPVYEQEGKYEAYVYEQDPEMNRIMNRSLANYQSISSMISSQKNDDDFSFDEHGVTDSESKDKNIIAGDFDLRRAVIYSEILEPKYKEFN